MMVLDRHNSTSPTGGIGETGETQARGAVIEAHSQEAKCRPPMLPVHVSHVAPLSAFVAFDKAFLSSRFQAVNRSAFYKQS